MALQVVGSGLGRTGTKSLKEALELLLGAPCYHMMECFGRPEDPSRWHEAMRGEPVDWDDLFDGFAATVDWPSAACWKELAAAYPDALILHSERPADEWFRSADATILEGFKVPREEWPAPGENAWWDMAIAMFEDRFTPDFLDRDAAVAAVEAWNADVRATAPADRLLIWPTGAGWEPICEALGVPVPDEPFPHTNTTAEFRQRSRTINPGPASRP
jgi:hypothetical protein